MSKKLSSQKVLDKYGAKLGEHVFSPADSGLVLPSPILTLNWAMGGGIPYGRIVELLGEESGGKSLMAMEFAKVAQALGGQVIWVDAEWSLTKEWAELNGLSYGDMVILNENGVEVISDFLKDAAYAFRAELTHNEPILMVVDSTAALDSLEAMEMSQQEAKAEMGIRAKSIYQMLRIRNKIWANLGICVIFINQIRDVIKTGFMAKMGNEDTSPGGKALRFYAAIRLGLYHKKQYKVDGKRVGAFVSVRTKKNKVAPPRDSFEARVVFDPTHWEPVGFDPYYGFAGLIQDLNILDKSGYAFLFDGEKIANGKDHLEEVLREDAELRGDLIAATDLHTPKALQNKLDELDKNYFPV